MYFVWQNFAEIKEWFIFKDSMQKKKFVGSGGIRTQVLYIESPH